MFDRVLNTPLINQLILEIICTSRVLNSVSAGSDPTTTQKMKFYDKDLFLSHTKPAGNCGFGHIF